MEFCSIAAGVDPAALRLTLDDIRAHHPGAPIAVLDVDGTCTDWADITVLEPADIGVPDPELHAAVMLGDRVELAQWLLPRLLEHEVQRRSPVVFVAAGMRVLRPVDELAATALAGGIAVVARCDGFPDEDGASPTAADLVARGPYHDAVLAVSEAGVSRLRDWARASNLGPGPAWQTSLAAFGVRVLPAHVVVSRWNVGPATRLDVEGDDMLLEGRVAAFVDLSNFDPDRPWTLSTLGADTARARLSEHPDLAAFCARHVGELAARKLPTAPWPFTETADGLLVDGPMRQAFREAVRAARSGDAAPPPDPFDHDDPGAFTRWLDEVVTDGVPLTRYLVSLYSSRPDLRREFPHVPGDDSARLVAWAELHARHEHDYAVRLVDSGARTARAANPSTRLRQAKRPAGLNVAGYLSGELGIGESARLMIEALRASHVPYSTISVGRNIQSRQSVDLGRLQGAPTRFDMTLLCVNADQTGAALQAEPDLIGSAYRIGMWYWEVEEFPPTMHGGFGHVNEAWVASEFVREAISRHTSLPVVTITPPLPQCKEPTRLSRTDIGLPDERPIFLFLFDYLSTAERKNPIGLVDAFRRAFARDEGPLLVIKSINGDKRVRDAERLRLRTADEPDVLLLEDYMTPEVRDALVQHCDAYVSLHRSEGLGLTIAEAMAYGKPAIATRYSGNLQFMNDENSFLVPWTPTTIPDDCAPYPAGGRWAQPDVDAAAAFMRLVVDEPTVAKARGDRGARDVRELHSPAVAGVAVSQRLAEIRRELPRIRWRSRIDRARTLARRARQL